MTDNQKRIIYNLLAVVPDKLYLSIMYRFKMKKRMNWDNPVTFNEKLQWLKINDRKSIYTNMVDKYEAKKYVSEKIGEEYIIPTLGIWDDFDDIDFDALPNQFVLKCTHDSGGLVICKDKENLNYKEVRKKIVKSLRHNYYRTGREWPYKNVKPRIIAEEYMKNENSVEGLIDYKFYCFNGEPKYLYISEGLDNHSTAKISFLTTNWEFSPFRRSDYKPFEKLPKKPSQFDEMVEYAKLLSKDIPFLRVDLYEINNKIYFSELTFFPSTGMMPFEPKEWDRTFGDWIDLPPKK